MSDIALHKTITAVDARSVVEFIDEAADLHIAGIYSDQGLA